MTLTMKLAFIGAGNMGAPMARNLLPATISLYTIARARTPNRWSGKARRWRIRPRMRRVTRTP